MPAIAEKGIRQLELDIQQLQGKQTKYERNIADKEQELITLQEENKELGQLLKIFLIRTVALSLLFFFAESAEKAKSAEHKEVTERFKAAKEAAKEQKRFHSVLLVL